SRPGHVRALQPTGSGTSGSGVAAPAAVVGGDVWAVVVPATVVVDDATSCCASATTWLRSVGSSHRILATVTAEMLSRAARMMAMPSISHWAQREYQPDTRAI